MPTVSSRDCGVDGIALLKGKDMLPATVQSAFPAVAVSAL
jgi:hypothetical protein